MTSELVARDAEKYLARTPSDNLAKLVCDNLAKLVRTSIFHTITATARSREGRSFLLTNMVLTHPAVTFGVALHGHQLDGETGKHLRQAIELSMKATGVEDEEWLNSGWCSL